MAVRCKEMTERLKIIEDQEIEAIEAIDDGLEFDKDAPVHRRIERLGVIRSRSVLGGLHHQYYRI
jgi:hypothetical protein